MNTIYIRLSVCLSVYLYISIYPSFQEWMYSTVSTFNTTTEVPLCKALNPQLLPGHRSINGCPQLRVCVHGGVCVCVCVWCVCVCVCVWCVVCVVCVCVCVVFTAVCMHLDGWIQSTNSEYGSQYLAVCHFTFNFTIRGGVVWKPVRKQSAIVGY